MSCSTKPLNKEQLASYIQKKENGLQQKEEINGIDVRVSYQPKEMLVYQEMGEENKPTKHLVDSITNKYKAQEYFTIGLSKDHKEVIRQLAGFSEYSDMLQVLSFQMSDKMMMITDHKDTIPMTDYLFQQTFGMSNENTLMLVFSNEKLKGASEWTLYVKEFGLGIGNLKFVFRRADIDRIPSMKELSYL